MVLYGRIPYRCRKIFNELNPSHARSAGEDIWRPQWVRMHGLFSVTFWGSPTTYRKKEYFFLILYNPLS